MHGALLRASYSQWSRTPDPESEKKKESLQIETPFLKLSGALNTRGKSQYSSLYEIASFFFTIYVVPVL